MVAGDTVSIRCHATAALEAEVPSIARLSVAAAVAVAVAVADETCLQKYAD